jgi:cytochrome P450/NADPH-cytochrome P450 reductase
MYRKTIRLARITHDRCHGTSCLSIWEWPLTSQIFQNFDVRPHNPDYKLKIKQTLTVKPDNFYMHVAPRKGRDIKSTLGASGGKAGSMELGGMSKDFDGSTGGKVDLSIYYGTSISVCVVMANESGSNSGKCKALARQLAAMAGRRGLGTEMKELNAVASGNLPTDRPVAIVTTSYEGQVSAPSSRAYM